MEAIVKDDLKKYPPRLCQNCRLIPSDSAIALFGILFTAAYIRVYPEIENSGH